MSPAERWVRFAVRAFPSRWRRHSGDALVDTAVEMVGDLSQRPSIALLVDIVFAGWRERRRDRPPLWSWLAYAYSGSRKAAARHGGWVRDDIVGRLYPVRLWLRMMLPFLVLSLVASAAIHDGRSTSGRWMHTWFWFVVPFGVVQLAVHVAMAGRKRRQAAMRFGLALTDTPLPEPQDYSPWAFAVVEPAPSNRAAPIATLVAAACFLVGVTMWWGAAHSLTVARWFGRRLVTDHNSPVSAGVAAVLAASGGVVGLALFGLVAGRLRGRGAGLVVDRPALTAMQRRRSQVALVGFGLVAAQSCWVGYVGALPDLASAAAASGLLAVAGGAGAVGWALRGTNATVADLVTPRRRLTTARS